MKAVRNAPPSVEVVDVDEPEGEGNSYGSWRRESAPRT